MNIKCEEKINNKNTVKTLYNSTTQNVGKPAVKLHN